MESDEFKAAVVAAQGGDVTAFARIVRRFQHMAFGYAYAMLGEFHLAEDAAQEAFIEAYRRLGSLRDPAAFPAWFRRIVLGRCSRLTRRNRVATAPLSHAAGTVAGGPGPAEEAEKRDMADRVMAAVRTLPDEQRTVTTLYYVNGYSHRGDRRVPGGPGHDGQQPAARLA